ncbi:hypothetical protein LY048_004086 [Salmonella enterica]|nr:hypothetical protein [Salmonella enterica]EJG7296711.1 hypothetical protein [Salmonella enterica]EJH2090126.1 hypothetical protein [Salmonella enterica]
MIKYVVILTNTAIAEPAAHPVKCLCQFKRRAEEFLECFGYTRFNAMEDKENAATTQH